MSGEPEQKDVSLGQLFVDVIVKPVDAFAAIARAPGVKWLFPAALLILSSLLVLLVQAPYLAEEAQKQLQMQLATMPPDQAEVVRQQAGRLISPVALMVSGSLSAVVILGLMWLLMSGLLYFLAMLAGADVTFGVAWAMAPWITLPFVLRSLLEAAWVYVNHALLRYPGLTFLISTGNLATDTRNPLFPVLAQIDPFGIWYAILVYAALRGGFNLQRRTAVLLTLVYLAIMLGVSTLPIVIANAFT